MNIFPKISPRLVMDLDNTINSSGVIPLSYEHGKWKIFLIQYRGYEQYWGCPKGHLKTNETHEEAAKRELKEETGLEIISFLHKEPLLEEFYWFKKNERLLKRVYFFVAQVTGTIILQKEEIHNGQWFTVSEAIEKLIYPEGKVTLKNVEQILIKHKKLI